MNIDVLKVGGVISGPVLPEAVEILSVISLGASAVRIIGKGLTTGLVRDSVFTDDQIAQLNVRPERPAFDGNAAHFRLGIEAQRLGLAYEYDPYLSLSIARVDPLHVWSRDRT